MEICELDSIIKAKYVPMWALFQRPLKKKNFIVLLNLFVSCLYFASDSLLRPILAAVS